MSATLEVTLDRSDLKAALSALDDRLSDMSPVWEEIGASLLSSTQHRFEVGKDPDGNPWRISRRVAENGGQTLVDNNRLLNSLTYEVGSNDVRLGSNVIYAGVHQEGAIIRAKGANKLKFQVNGSWVTVDQVEIPARPYLGLSGEDEQEILAILNDHIEGALQ